MNKRLVLTAVYLLAAAATAVRAQEPGENARDGFKSTRKSVAELNETYGKSPPVAPQPSSTTMPPPSPPATLPRPPAAPPPAGAAPTGPNVASRRTPRRAPKRRAPAPHAPPEQTAGSPAPAPAQAFRVQPTVGLGYTLFLKNEVGEYVNVSPSRVFRTGDRMRLLVETNQSGYLYVFHQENGGEAKMLYPHYSVADGRNDIQAHHTTFVPQRNSFHFTGGPATEVFTVVFSRTPIPGLPTGEALAGLKHVPVPPEVFRRVLQQPCLCREDKLAPGGRPLTDKEGTRDVELGAEDPEPDFILMNRNRGENRIATQIRLVHR